MPEPRTHYQVSFTSRQAVLLFVVILVALTGAFFLGILTGMAGRQTAESASASVSPVPPTPAGARRASGEGASSTPPATTALAEQERTAAPQQAAREPGKAEGLVFFEDRPAEPTPQVRASARQATAPPKSAGGFWVQVLSTTSEHEANTRRTFLSGRGYRTAVEPTRAPKGPVLYRVRVGPYSSREEASKAAQELERREKAKTWIVPPGE